VVSCLGCGGFVPGFGVMSGTSWVGSKQWAFVVWSACIPDWTITSPLRIEAMAFPMSEFGEADIVTMGIQASIIWSPCRLMAWITLHPFVAAMLCSNSINARAAARVAWQIIRRSMGSAGTFMYG